MLNGHLDTVGVSGYVGDPFVPRIENGRLLGRGSIDMKAGVSAMLIAAERAARARPEGDIVVACVADEEHASLGSSEVAAQYQPGAVIIPEPTDEEIIVTHKGFVWAEIVVEGRAAHGSRSDLGVDAIAKAGRVLTAIETLDQRLRAGPTKPLLGTGSMHASMISGGQEMSSYPAACRIGIERRTVPGENVGTVAAELEAIVAEIKAKDPTFAASFTTGLARDPMARHRSDEILGCLLQAATPVLGSEPPISGFAGWTDCALFAERGVPSILFGPKGGGLHSAIEWADIASLERVAVILERAAIGYCNGNTADKDETAHD
jgi:acetylornithine deacetylase